MTKQEVTLPRHIAAAVSDFDFVLAYRFLMRLWDKIELETWRTYRLRVEELEREHLAHMAQVRLCFAMYGVAA